MSTVYISKEYMGLIKCFPLRPIRDEEMLDIATEVFSDLVMKADRRTGDESDYLMVLGKLIREFEESHQTRARRMTPKRALESLMEDNQLSQSELARQIGAPQSVISEFLAGKRGLSKALVLNLSDRFKVSPVLFLSAKTKARG